MSRDLGIRAELIDTIQRATRRVNGQSVIFTQVIADRLGMNATDLECLGSLLDDGAMTAGRLAELTGLTTGAITGVIDRLERAGFVRRERDPADRRRVIVEPVADKARREIGPLFSSVEKAWGAHLARYTEEQLGLILDFLERSEPLMREEIAKLRGDAAATVSGAGESAAPLGSVTSGRLVFVSGASRTAIRADPALPDLFRARFDGPTPQVQVQGGDVTIQERRLPFNWRRRTSEISLNATIPWNVELEGGMSHVAADLRRLHLIGLKLSGGASKVNLSLPPPRGAVAVRISGGANKVAINRPAGTAIRVQVEGGFNQLVFDGQRVAYGEGDRRETPDYDRASDRYDLSISGGASEVVVGAE